MTKNKCLLLLIVLFSMNLSYGNESYTSVGVLKTNKHNVTVLNGPEGPLYTVHSKDGVAIAANLSEAELTSKLPYLKGILQRGIADDASLSREQKTPSQTGSFSEFIDLGGK